MRKSYIFSWLLFLLVSSSRIKTYSLLNWPKVYIPHWWDVYWKSVGIMPFSRIFWLLFDTLTNNVLFLFLILHLFKCVALLCIYIIVIVLLLIYMWDFNSFMYNGYIFIWVTSGSFVPHIDCQIIFFKL